MTKRVHTTWTFGERQEADRWYEEQRGRLVRLCTAIVREHSTAEDIANETFARAIAHGVRFESASRPWLNAVARNLCFDHLRSRRRFTTLADHEDHAAGADLDRVVDSVDRAEERSAMLSALADLPPRDRRILWLRDAEGLAYEEITRLDGTSAQAARNRAYRARNMVRDRIAAAVSRLAAAIVLFPRRLRQAAREAGTVMVAVAGALAVLNVPPPATRPPETRSILPAAEGRATLQLQPDHISTPPSPMREPGASLVPSPATDGTPGVSATIDRRHRRPDAIYPERAGLEVQVRGADGSLLLRRETVLACSRHGEGLGTDERVLYASC